MSEDSSPRVLIAILARNTAHTLHDYLGCIENLDYPKERIVLYIRTNNNVDQTEMILWQWIDHVKDAYHAVEYNDADVSLLNGEEKDFVPHDWYALRFAVLGRIRQASLQKAKQYECDYYFVADCDNFLAANTLRVLIDHQKPIIAPMLRAIPHYPEDRYCNFLAADDSTGYYTHCALYDKILDREEKGCFEVPVVHCTYLVDSRYIDQLLYCDDSEDYEFIIFAKSARAHDIAQYISNEHDFGVLVHNFDTGISLEESQQQYDAHWRAFIKPYLAVEHVTAAEDESNAGAGTV